MVKRDGRGRRATGRGARGDSRARLLRAARAAFAARGYAGAGVDRIARAAGLNKAMVYYHFGSKAGLYRALLRELFDALAGEAAAIAATAAPPDEKLAAYIDAVARALATRPEFPAIWLRELADAGRHLDRATLRQAAPVPLAVGRILEEGCRLGRFAPANPLLVHIGILTPLLFFSASGPLRRAFTRAGLKGAERIALTDVVAFVRQAMLGALAPPAAARGGASRSAS